MIQPFRSLGHAAAPRPFLDVLVGLGDFRVPGLVDSGAMHVLFHSDVANEANIDLSGAEDLPLSHGPMAAPFTAKTVTVQLSAAAHTWETKVGFADYPNLVDHGLLGLPFFNSFTVTFRSVDDEFEVSPIEM